MPLQLQGLNYDSKGNRANVVLVSMDGSGDMVQASFMMNTAGTDTQHEVNEKLKNKTKALLQEAIALL